MVAANRVAAIDPPIDNTDPIRNFGSRYGISVSTPHRRYRHDCGDAVFADAISETSKYAFAHFWALFLESAETPLFFLQINAFAVWALWLELEFTRLKAWVPISAQGRGLRRSQVPLFSKPSLWGRRKGDTRFVPICSDFFRFALHRANGRGRFGGQTAGGHPKAFPWPK